jgi:acyl carrier protein
VVSDSESDIANKIKTYFEETVFVEFGDNGISASDSFLDNGILDSVGFVALAVWLNEEFGVQVTDEEMIPENLDSLVNLVEFVRRKSQ